MTCHLTLHNELHRLTCPDRTPGLPRPPAAGLFLPRASPPQLGAPRTSTYSAPKPRSRPGQPSVSPARLPAHRRLVPGHLQAESGTRPFLALPATTLARDTATPRGVAEMGSQPASALTRSRSSGGLNTLVRVTL